MNWLFHPGALPPGYREALLQNVCTEFGSARLHEAARVLGDPALAARAAKVAGRYELRDDLCQALGLAGVALDEAGEIPALSPERWEENPTGESRSALGLRLAEEGRELAGLMLEERQRELFLRFLARNRVSNLTALKAVSLARHFFSAEPVTVVIRYTAAQS
ncbi:MAG: hypothetical protein ACXVB9_03135 [Bdellovibrionota bacterium]